jgi:hypothetical protein
LRPFSYLTLIFKPAGKPIPLITTAVTGAPEEGVMVNGGTTVKAAVPEMTPEVAVMVVAPSLTAVANPPLDTVAAEVRDEDHVTLEVRFWVLESE